METIKKILINLQFGDIISYGLWDFVINVLLFIVFAGSAFYFFWVLYHKKFGNRRIQPRHRNPFSSVRYEIKNSIVTLLIFTIIDALIYFAMLKGYTRIYTDVDKYGWGYLALSVVVIILLHDAIYYFMHRLMHLPKIYERVHRVHHHSTDPSPFAAFSFHPLEAVLESVPYIVFAFLFPVHLVALWTWQMVQISLNVIAHLGYEIYPKGFNTHWLFRFKTPSTHHNMHHSKVNGNYGFYFTWWDRIFGTEFKDYNRKYEEIHERIHTGKSTA